MFKKGQMIFQFIIGAVIFFSIVLFIIAFLNNTVSGFGSDAAKDTLQAKAMAVSEIIVRGAGVWAGNTPETVGLASEWPALNSTKIRLLAEYCRNDFQGLRGKLGLDERVSDFSERGFNARIRISKDGVEMLGCGPETPPINTGTAERFGVSEDGTLLKIEVFVW